jgi:hypothetical protein
MDMTMRMGYVVPTVTVLNSQGYCILYLTQAITMLTHFRYYSSVSKVAGYELEDRNSILGGVRLYS